MKKLFTLLFSITLLLANAQAPQLEGTYLPVVGTAIKQVYDTTNLMPVPTIGTNQFWDYSNTFITPTDTFLLETFPPNDSRCVQYSQNFPTATHVSFLRAPFYVGDSTFFYFRIDTVGVWGIGYFDIHAAIDTPAFATDEEFVIPANATYNSVLVDTTKGYSNGVQILNFGKFNLRSYKYKTDSAVGYGSLKTPAGTFNDVLLIREHVTGVDSIFNTNNVYLTKNIDNYTRYYFLRNNTFGSNVLMELHYGVSNPNFYFAWYTLPTANGFIQGMVHDSDGTAITYSMCPTCEVYLYRENSNFSKDDILDRSKLDSLGNYRFDSIPYGEYRISFRPDNSIPKYLNALTTYYGDSTDWLKVVPINTLINKSDTVLTTPITLQYHGGNSLHQNLKGSLSLNLGLSKNGPSDGPVPYILGQTVPGVDIIIKKCPCGIMNNGSGGSPSHEVRTNSNGNFQIDTLDMGVYEMYVDIPGLLMSGTYTFTISGGASNLTNLDFTVGRDSIHPNSMLGLGVKTYSKNNFTVNAYPNPFSNTLNLTYNLDKSETVTVDIVDILGNTINIMSNKPQLKGGQYIQVNLSEYNLSEGIYHLKMTTDHTTISIPLIKLN